MRWIAESEPKEGDIRVVKKFAFLPIRIGRDVRWLESCKIEMIYKFCYYMDDYYWAWVYKRFIDD